MLGVPKPVDAEVSAATFAAHLDEFWKYRRPSQSAWGLTRLDDLHAVVTLPARRTSGETENYHLKLGAEFYDAWPPMVSFAQPETWIDAVPKTRWFPKIENAPDFGLHDSYGYLDGQRRPLICFTFAAQYYQTSHSPPEHTVWKQGRHTLAATVNRIAAMLQAPYYRGPSAP